MWPAILVVLAGVLALAGLLAFLAGPSDKIASAELDTRVPPPVSSAGTPAPNWTYTNDRDEMTGEQRTSACTSSPEGATLCFRKTDSKLESFLRFPADSKQFLCTAYRCTTEVRIDDQPVFSAAGQDSPDKDLSILYLVPPDKLLASLRNAKEAKFEPPIFDEEGLVLHFNVSGLNW